MWKDPRGKGRQLAPVGMAVEDEVGDQQTPDIVEHERGDDLVGAEERPQRTRDGRPGGSGHQSSQDHRRDDEGSRLALQSDGNSRGTHRSQVQLPFSADVPGLHAEGGGSGEAGQQQRRCLDQGRAQRPFGEEAAVQQTLPRRQRIMPGRQQDDAGEDHGADQRSDWNRHHQPAGLTKATLNPNHAAPAIIRPSSSTTAFWRSTTPMMRPPYNTAIRSASAKISSRSSLIRRMATPRAAASSSRPRTASVAATSRPRVGEAATSTLGRLESSRASRTFCTLPPDSNRVGVCGAGATPCPMRSSGTWLTLCWIAARGSPERIALPAIETVPLVSRRMPVMTSASSRWPLPATPAMPTISPAWTVRSTFCRASVPRSLKAVTPRRSRTTSRSVWATASFFCVKTTSRPTIIRASCRGLVSLVRTVPISFP